MTSPFKNKILVPTLFAYSNQIHQIMPAENPMTVLEKLAQKRKKQLHTSLLTILQRKDDVKRQTIIGSPQLPLKSHETNRKNTYSKSLSSKKKAQQDEIPQHVEMGSLNFARQGRFDEIIEAQQTQKDKLSDLRERIKRKGIVARSIQQKKKDDLQAKFDMYHKKIDSHFNITRIENLKVEQEKAERAKQFRDFLERSAKNNQKDLKSKHKRQGKRYVGHQSSRELKRPKSISQFRPLFSKIQAYHKQSGVSIKKFEDSLKQLQSIQGHFKMNINLEAKKQVIDYLNDYRERQIKENRSGFANSKD